MGCGSSSTAAAPEEKNAKSSERYKENNGKTVVVAQDASPNNTPSASTQDLFGLDTKDITKYKKRKLGKSKSKKGDIDRVFNIVSHCGECTGHSMTMAMALSKRTLRLPLSNSDAEQHTIREVLGGHQRVCRENNNKVPDVDTTFAVDAELFPGFTLSLTPAEITQVVAAKPTEGGYTPLMGTTSLAELLAPRLQKATYQGGTLRYIQGFSRPFVALSLSVDEKSFVGTQRGRQLSPGVTEVLVNYATPAGGGSDKRSSSSSVRSALQRQRIENYEKAIRHFDVRTGQLIGVFKSKETSPLKELEYTWNDADPVVIGGSTECTVSIFNACRNRIIRTVEASSQFEELMMLTCLKLSEDNRLFAVGGSCDNPDGQRELGLINVYEVTDKSTNLVQIQGFGGHSRSVSCLSFHPTNSNIIASGDIRGDVLVWRAREATLLQQITALMTPVRAVVINRTGLMYAADDRFIRCWVNAEAMTKAEVTSDNFDPQKVSDDASREGWSCAFEPLWHKHNDTPAERSLFSDDAGEEAKKVANSGHDSDSQSDDGRSRSVSSASSSEARKSLASVMLSPAQPTKRRLRGLNLAHGDVMIVMSTGNAVCFVTNIIKNPQILRNFFFEKVTKNGRSLTNFLYPSSTLR